MAEAGRCPSCGAELPAELRQHALTPVSGLVQCPTCGQNVELDEPGDEPAIPRATETVGGESGAPETFSGEETIEGVMEELEDKPGGPKGDA